MSAATWVPFGLTLLGLVVGGGTLLDVLSARRRLAARLSSDLDILAKLPEGRAHDALRQRVERDTLELASAGISYTTAELRRRNVGVYLYLLPYYFRYLVVPDPHRAAPLWLWIVGLVLALAGLGLLMSARASRDRRRRALQRPGEVQPATPKRSWLEVFRRAGLRR